MTLINNSTVDRILARRSVREGYLDRPVDEETLRTIVACGCAAPSSKGAEPWRFHVVVDRSVLAAIADDMQMAPGADTYVPTDPFTGEPRPDWPSTVAESADVVRRVPACIFVENRGVFSRGRAQLVASSPEVLAESLVGYTLEVLGVGAAVQNVQLAAQALGLGCAFMGDVLVAEAAIRRRLRVEGDLVGGIAMGHTNTWMPPRTVSPTDPRVAVWH